MADGEVPAKEYDYLLTMPLWSLSEEKVAELNRQLDEKKDDHDELDATHIHTLWDRDLDALLEALGEQEDKDERDRLAHKGRVVGSGGGKKAPRRRAKPVAKDEEAKGGKAAAGKENQGPHKNQQEIVKKRQPGEKPAKAAPKKIKAAKEPEAASQPAKEPAELSLRERLALRAQEGDKVPAQTNPLYDELRGMGKGLSGAGVDILKGDVGRKRRKGDSSDSD